MASSLEDLLEEVRAEGDAEGAAEVIRRVRRRPVTVTSLPSAALVESSPEWRAARMAQAWSDLLNDRGIE
ncbi:MAG: hypothetical protein Q8S73_41175 [Deltaproteobacteria bacterium]|nr:hypothetical protein [Myxococcales bacterium]MDP3220573.1 hypothetical protein [Deltaproteobacteria bacterium]